MASQVSPLSRESQIATSAPGSCWPAVQRTQAPACASSVPPSRKLVNWIHALVRDLLPVIDNVERAIEAGEKNADAAALLEGFKMVNQQLDDVLKRHHTTRIEALHAPFDPNVHHAILQQPSEEHPANTVLMVTQNGYQLHDRVVRPAQVIVSTK